MNFILKAEELDKLQAYLLERKWIAPDEKVQTAKKPGEGNMNYTLRVRTNFRSFIIKQSRDYVEKYPDIPAPRERAVIEGHFYELVQVHPTLQQLTPEINNVDKVNSIIMMEDLGESTDFSFIYKPGEKLEKEDFSKIIEFSNFLHQNFQDYSGTSPIANRAMRELNAEHIFNYPFMEENGFDLDDVTQGLQEMAMKYKTDAALKGKIKSLSEHYTGDGNILLHGDYYPGSWLKTLEGVRIIDPEFCFYGKAEFDISVTLAHLKMAEQGEELEGHLWKEYHGPEGFSQALCFRLAGVEIMRRLIGLAQLPLSLDLTKKAELLQNAYDMIMSE